MRVKPSSYFLIFILLLMFIVIIVTAPLPRIEAKIVPLIIAVFVILLAAFELSREMLAKDEGQQAVEDKQPEQKFGAGDVRGFGIAMG